MINPKRRIGSINKKKDTKIVFGAYSTICDKPKQEKLRPIPNTFIFTQGKKHPTKAIIANKDDLSFNKTFISNLERLLVSNFGKLLVSNEKVELAKDTPHFTQIT